MTIATSNSPARKAIWNVGIAILTLALSGGCAHDIANQTAKQDGDKSQVSKESEISRALSLSMMGRCLKEIGPTGFAVEFRFKERDDFNQDYALTSSEKSDCLSLFEPSNEQQLLSLIARALRLPPNARLTYSGRYSDGTRSRVWEYSFGGYKLQRTETSFSLRCPNDRDCVKQPMSEVTASMNEHKARQLAAQRQLQEEARKRDQVRLAEAARKEKIWQEEVKATTDKANREKQAQREKCLSNGSVGVCHAAATNTAINICGTGFTLNPDCLVTDTWTIEVSLEARNNFKKEISDLTFTCTQRARSGTVLREDSKIFYDRWEPGAAKAVKFKVPKHEQVAGVACRATKWR